MLFRSWCGRHLLPPRWSPFWSTRRRITLCESHLCVNGLRLILSSVSPSVYVVFESIAANNLCGEVGTKIINKTLAFNPTDLSTQRNFFAGTTGISNNGFNEDYCTHATPIPGDWSSFDYAAAEYDLHSGPYSTWLICCFYGLGKEFVPTSLRRGGATMPRMTRRCTQTTKITRQRKRQTSLVGLVVKERQLRVLSVSTTRARPSCPSLRKSTTLILNSALVSMVSKPSLILLIR